MTSWGLYKPGQGYWVRVLTAAVIALIAFATAGWLMAQMNVLSTKFPVRNWVSEVANLSNGSPVVGDKVSLIRFTDGGAGKPETLGVATITSYDASSALVRIGKFEPAPPSAANPNAPTPRAEDASAIEAAGGTGVGGFKANVRNGVRGLPMIQSIYLQGGAAAITLLIGALIAYYFCGVKPGTVEFLIATDMEMKKVNWSTAKDIRNSTLVVVFAAFLLAGILFSIDIVFQFFFRAINVLQ